MKKLKLHLVGNDQQNSGYKLFEDENGKLYSAFFKNEEVMMETFATLNESGERDMPVFTKEYCEYEGIERDEYTTIEIECVRLSLTYDEAKRIKFIISAILNNRKFMKGSMLRESHIYDIDSEDIETMENLIPLLEHKETSPILKQFYELKEKFPDVVLLFRCGDFYETYEEDAEICSEILGIVLTKRTCSDMKLSAFPFHALDTYLPKLIRAGKRVAICDQLQNTKTL